MVVCAAAVTAAAPSNIVINRTPRPWVMPPPVLAWLWESLGILGTRPAHGKLSLPFRAFLIYPCLPCLHRLTRGSMSAFFRLALVAAFFISVSSTGSAQAAPSTPAHQSINDILRELVETPAVTGYEQSVGKKIVARIKAMPQRYAVAVDRMGNIAVTVGSGAPRRLVVASFDEPGFVVSGITPEGYLTLQRLPQGGNL